MASSMRAIRRALASLSACPWTRLAFCVAIITRMASRVAAASAVSVCVVRPGGSTEGVRDADVDPAGVVDGMPRLALAAELGSCMLDGGGGDGSLGGDPMGERGSGRRAASRASASAAWRAAIRWTRRCSARDARSMALGLVMGTLMLGLVLLVLMKRPRRANRDDRYGGSRKGGGRNGVEGFFFSWVVREKKSVRAGGALHCASDGMEQKAGNDALGEI